MIHFFQYPNHCGSFCGHKTYIAQIMNLSCAISPQNNHISAQHLYQTMQSRNNTTYWVYITLYLIIPYEL